MTTDEKKERTLNEFRLLAMLKILIPKKKKKHVLFFKLVPSHPNPWKIHKP